MDAAAVVSFDGLPMASALPAGMEEDRVAAMSAALLSLAERAAQGLGRGDLSQVYLEGEHGAVFLVSAQDEGVLIAVSAPGAKVGMMLFEVRLAAARVAEVLAAPSPSASLVEQPSDQPAEEYRYVQDHRVEVVSAAPGPIRSVSVQSASIEPAAVQPADEPVAENPALYGDGSYPASSYFVADAHEQLYG